MRAAPGNDGSDHRRVIATGPASRGAGRWVPALLLVLALAVGLLSASGRALAADAAQARDPTAVTAGLSWDEEAIRASHRLLASPDLPAIPPGLDPLDQVVVVEQGGHGLAVFDGKAARLHGRIALAPRQLAAPPRFSPDGRLAYISSVDGWVSLVDLVGLRMLAEIRVAQRLRDLAISGDGRWLLAANASPNSLVLLRADLGLERVYALRSADGRRDSAAAAVADAAVRRRFVVALESLPELWEISYDPHAEDIYDGMVHDFRMGEGIPRRGFLGVRRITLPRPLASLFIDPIQAHALGHAGPGPGDVVNLDVRRRIETLAASAPARPADLAVVLMPPASRVVLLPVPNRPALQPIDMKTWRPLAAVDLPAPALLARTHSATSRVWALLDGRGSQGRVAVLAKEGWSLENVLREPGLDMVDLDLGREGERLLVLGTGREGGGLGSLLIYEGGDSKPSHRLPVAGATSVQGVAGAIQRAQGRVP